MSIIEINDTDVASLGFRTVDLADWWGMLSQGLATAPAYGGYRSASEARHTANAVRWPLSLMLFEDAKANRTTQLVALRRLFRSSPPSGWDTLRHTDPREVQIRVDGSDLVAYGIYLGDRARQPRGIAWSYGHTEVTVDILFREPAKYSVATTEVEVDDTPTQATLGDLPSRWTLDIAGAGEVNPVLVVQEDDGGSAGDELWRLPLTVTVDSGEDLHVSELDRQITVDDVDDTEDILPVGDGNYFRPLDSGGASQVWVSLEATSGTPTGTLKYRRRWR